MSMPLLEGFFSLGTRQVGVVRDDGEGRMKAGLP
jgi:hypothetical protein